MGIEPIKEINKEAFNALLAPGITIMKNGNAFANGTIFASTASDSCQPEAAGFPAYVTPKYKAGTVVTYTENGSYKMGKIKSAIFLEKTWRYRIVDAYSEVYECMIKEAIVMDNQEFFEKL